MYEEARPALEEDEDEDQPRKGTTGPATRGGARGGVILGPGTRSMTLLRVVLGGDGCRARLANTRPVRLTKREKDGGKRYNSCSSAALSFSLIVVQVLGSNALMREVGIGTRCDVAWL